MPLRGGNHPESTQVQGVILVLVQGAAERARVRAALRSRYDVRFVDRTIELTQLAMSACAHLAGVVVEPRDIDGRSTVEAIEQLRASVPVPLLAFSRPGPHHARELSGLIMAGVHEVLYEDADITGVAVRAVLESAQRAQVGERVAEALMATMPGRLRPLVRYATAHPETQRVSSLAEALGYNRKTLVNHCAVAGYPPPQELLAWCRLAVVGELLTRTTRTIESIALQLDFPSDTALRNMIKRYTGLRASEVRAQGGLRCILNVFEVAMLARRGIAEVAS
jgi:methylphosphotriester-DNA--protein-cysteine methyltransferase